MDELLAITTKKERKEGREFTAPGVSIFAIAAQKVKKNVLIGVQVQTSGVVGCSGTAVDLRVILTN